VVPLLLTLVVLLPVLPGCGTSRMVDAGQSPSPYRPPTPAGLDEYFPAPGDNPLTAAKVALGRRLFFDPVLSRDSTVACSSCHRPERGFSDTVPTSIGIAGQRTTRNAPTLLNRAYGVSLFWDGRAVMLEDAVLQPVRNAREMAHDPARVAERLARDRGYAGEFARAFEDGVSTRNLARALASFVRSLRSGNAAIDRYLAGDRSALSPEARAGLGIFAGRGNCVMCHSGATFTDERFHNTGVSWGTDPGRFGVTGDSADRGAFKTPTLRNVARTGPYMHDGSLGTLEDVLAFYDRGGNPNPNLDPEIRPLRLTAEERRALRAFLEALTGQ
jgi:cytochrome c peroxidase